MQYTVSRKEIPEADGLSQYTERQQAEGFPQEINLRDHRRRS